MGGTLPSETNERSTFNISQQIVLCLDAANLIVGLGFLHFATLPSLLALLEAVVPSDLPLK